MNSQSPQGQIQAFVDRTPAYESNLKKKKKVRRENQIMSQSGIIHPDKRFKVKYL